MTYEERIELIAECLDLEPGQINPELALDDIESWDSVAVLSVISIINDCFDRFPSSEEIMAYKTIGDLLDALQ